MIGLAIWKIGLSANFPQYWCVALLIVITLHKVSVICSLSTGLSGEKYLCMSHRGLKFHPALFQPIQQFFSPTQCRYWLLVSANVLCVILDIGISVKFLIDAFLGKYALLSPVRTRLSIHIHK